MPPPRETILPVANRFFVDREQPQRLFERGAFAIPADRAIIRVFYGVGGQGKTALCRELMRKTDASLEPSYSFLRRSVLDLHGRQKSDPDLLLVWIRNGFADAGVVLPCFDLALALMWEGTRGEQPFPTLTKPWLAPSIKAAQAAVDEGASEIKKLLGMLMASGLTFGTISALFGWAAAHYLLGWDNSPAVLAGIALAATSVAVVYTVMMEYGFNRTAVIPTLIANKFYLPRHLLPKDEAPLHTPAHEAEVEEALDDFEVRS